MKTTITSLAAALISVLLACGTAFAATDSGNKTSHVTGFIMGGDGANINWETVVPGCADASYKTYFASQQGWELNRRLLDKKPEMVVLYFGTQEALMGQPLEYVKGGYDMLCNRIIKAGGTPLIALPLPVTSKFQVLGGRIASISAMIEDYCNEKGIGFFDPSAGLAHDGWLDESLSSDGIMLNTAGLEAFKNNILAAVDEYYNGDYISAGMNTVSRDIETIEKNAPKKTRVAFLGDSITAGGGDWGKLFGRKDMKNCGRGGYMSGQLLWIVDKTVIEAHPQTCVLMAGNNDIGNKIPMDVIVDNMTKIVMRLKAAGITPVVESGLYVLNSQEMNDKFDILNGRLKTWCEENDVKYLDINSILSKDHKLRPEYSIDGTHVNAEAYKVWAEYLTEQLGF